MLNDNETIKELRKKAKAYFNLKSHRIHITLINGTWRRGFIHQVESDYIVLDESIYGRIILFFSDIIAIESYRQLKKQEEKTKEELRFYG